MKDKLCLQCQKPISPDRLAEYPRTKTCCSLCQFALRHGMTLGEATVYKIRKAKASHVLKGEGPWPEPDPVPELNEFGLLKEGRAFES